VTANRGSGNLSVLLGTGNGTFQPAQDTFTGGSNPLAVAVGDFNADGKMDLAVTGYTPGYYSGYYSYTPRTSDVTVLLGHGDGTFAASSHHNLFGDYVPSIATEDLNGDGKVDLAWADQSASAVGVMLGNGDGTFALGAWLATDPGLNSVAVADLNGDGKPDLVTANWNASANVLLGNGDGTFQAAQSYFTEHIPISVGVADFNGDGKRDLVAASYGSDDVGVLLGNGDGSFRAAQDSAAGQGPTAVAAGDFNGDGRTDLAVADSSAGASVLLNAGDWRSFLVSGYPSPTTAGQAHAVTVTALDSDGGVMTGYTGTVHFTSSDPQAVLPTDYTFTAADNGTRTFTVTLKTAGTQSISVTDTGPTAFNGRQGGIAVNPAVVSTLQISGFPSPVSVGDSGYFSVTAHDAYGNLATNYTGTVQFTSSDGLATLPADFTFTAYNYGTAYFTATLRTVGTQSLTVTDTASPSVNGTQAGIRVVPLVTVSGPSYAARNQTLTFTLGANGMPAGTVFTYAIDWNGDGVVDQTVSGPSGATVQHTYSDSGGYYIGVTATVNVGAENYTSYAAYRYVGVLAVTATVQTDPASTTRQMLVIDGTASSDSIVVGSGADNGVTLSFDGTALGNILPTNGNPFALVIVRSEGGNDTLDARALAVSSVLVGGPGNDTLYGGSGRNLLVGGLGTDNLYAGSGGDILIGGTTSYDSNLTALAYIMAEWNRTDVSYAKRVAQLNGSQAGGMNGSYLLNSTTVFDDNAVDSMYGGTGLDWFFARLRGRNKDKVYNKTSGEVVTGI
jgi:hypothetical protein